MGRKKRPKLEAPEVPDAPASAEDPPRKPFLPQKGLIGQPPGTTNPLVCIPVPIEQKIPPPSILFGRGDDVEQKRSTSTQNRSITFDPRVKGENTTAATSTGTIVTAGVTSSAAAAALGKESSSYGMHSHSGDLIEEHIYVSDGSDDELNFNAGTSTSNDDDETNNNTSEAAEGETTKIRGETNDGLELLLTGSKMGLMRRGLAAQLYQPKTWIRQQAGNANGTLNSGSNGQNGTSAEDGDGNGNNDGDNQLQSEDEKIRQDSTLTQAEKAAQLLATKKQKEEELIQMKRNLESSENAGRDPCLFSKRTAFDIRMDQIEDKPWDRSTGGTADITDFFNYGLSEEDWLEYSQGQLTVRQELTDASRQRRSADPTIVPVVAKTPSKQTPKVAVAVKKEKKETPEGGDKDGDEDENGVVVQGPSIPKEMASKIKKEVDDDDDTKSDQDTISSKQSNKTVKGGVWGIDVTPGSKLAKLLEEQERNTNKNSGKEALPPPPPPPPLPMHQQNMNMHNDQQGGGYQSSHFQQQQKGPPPPPPPSFQDQYFPPPHHAPPGQYHRGNTYGRGEYHQGRGGPPQMSQHNQFYHDQNGGRGNQRGGRGNHFGGRGNQYGGRGDFGGRGRGRGGRGHWGSGPHQGQQFPGGRGGRGGGRGYMRDDWHRR